MSSFINVGNSKNSFPRFFSIIKKYLSKFPKPIYIQYGYTELKEDEFLGKDIFLYQFLEYEKYKELSRNSKLFISHGGIGSIQTALENNKVPIIIPRLKKYREIINNHQLEICEILEKQKKIMLVFNLIDFEEKLEILKSYKFSYKNNIFPDKEKLISHIRNSLLNYENIN